MTVKGIFFKTIKRSTCKRKKKKKTKKNRKLFIIFENIGLLL